MRRLGPWLREQYGEKVYKLSLSSGCTCPNRDGKLGFGGCSFCSGAGSGDFAAAFAPIEQQLEEARARIRRACAVSMSRCWTGRRSRSCPWAPGRTVWGRT